MTNCTCNKCQKYELCGCTTPGTVVKYVYDQQEKEEKKDPSLVPGTVAKKLDAGKLEWHLLPEDALEEVLRVFQYGKNKYGDFNWLIEPGFEYTRIDNSGRRHASKWRRGTDHDDESGLLELAHVCANYLMLLTYELRKVGIDNRKKLK